MALEVSTGCMLSLTRLFNCFDLQFSLTMWHSVPIVCLLWYLLSSTCEDQWNKWQSPDIFMTFPIPLSHYILQYYTFQSAMQAFKRALLYICDSLLTPFVRLSPYLIKVTEAPVSGHKIWWGWVGGGVRGQARRTIIYLQVFFF